MKNIERFFTLPEAADYLRCSTRTVLRYRYSGALTAIQHVSGGALLFKQSELDACRKPNEVKSSPLNTPLHISKIFLTAECKLPYWALYNARFYFDPNTGEAWVEAEDAGIEIFSLEEKSEGLPTCGDFPIKMPMQRIYNILKIALDGMDPNKPSYEEYMKSQK